MWNWIRNYILHDKTEMYRWQESNRVTDRDRQGGTTKRYYTLNMSLSSCCGCVEFFVGSNCCGCVELYVMLCYAVLYCVVSKSKINLESDVASKGHSYHSVLHHHLPYHFLHPLPFEFDCYYNVLWGPRTEDRSRTELPLSHKARKHKR